MSWTIMPPPDHPQSVSPPNALGITSRIVTLEDLFKLGRFRPASVQREYQWERANCEVLFEDLKHALEPHDHAAEHDPGPGPDDRDDDAVDAALIPDTAIPHKPAAKSYYLGALVVKVHPGGNYDVYDGLQRLTTLTVLIAILRDLTTTNDIARRLGALIINTSLDPRLTLRTGNIVLREEIQKPGAAAKSRRARRNLTATELRVRAVTAYLYQHIKDWPEARIDRFATRLMDAACIGLTEVDDEVMARQIFVSTNLHGVRLNRVDLCKGQLMDIAADDAAGEAILKTWTGLQTKLGAGFDAFLVAIDFIERREPQGVDCLTRLAAHIEATQGAANIVVWVQSLRQFAEAWTGLHERTATLHERRVDADIWKLRLFWWPEWRPLALLWYRDYLAKCDKNGMAPQATWAAFNRRFEALHGRCLALILADFTPNERARIFGKAIAQTRDGRDPLKNALAFHRNALEKIRQSLIVPLTDELKRHAAIRWIEASLWGSKIPAYVGEATVEHVLPQRSADGSNWRTSIEDDEDRYDAAHSLGNLVMLDKPRNLALNNADYAAKHAAFQAPPAFKTLAQVAVHGEWNRDTIRTREKELADYVLEKLALPEFVARSRATGRTQTSPDAETPVAPAPAAAPQ
jgi:Protein of unknown function DUF262/Protein of unknown function (DUF1524)